MIKVYIASPYTEGDVALNVRRQIETGDELIQFGYVPYLPLLSHFQHMMFPHEYDVWLKLDLVWVKQCDVLLRLTGESKGADLEVEEARTYYIPIAFTIEELIKRYPTALTF